jgi:hypothetical protein
MLNKDINARFDDWLVSPAESLDFEVKGWLDMEDPEAQGLVAKALIALENHGGGFLLFGYTEDADKKLVPDGPRPASLKPYLTDSLNAIVKRRAEPSFHVEVSVQKHPDSGDEYPLVRVRGTSKVPVRSDSATPGGTLKQHVYYIRAPGPESRGPRNGSEWDALLRRAVLNQREEIVSVLRAYLPSAGGMALLQAAPAQEALRQFAAAATTRWKTLNESLPVEHPARIKLGHFSFAARVLGEAKGLTAAQVLSANERAKRYTGWPTFVTIHQEPTKPKLIDDCIEAWMAETKYPDVGHADFWRIHPDGLFFLLRGYQEDAVDGRGFTATPGALFEATLPIWRLGEFLLRVSELATLMFEEGFEIMVQCEWTGLTARQLFVHNARRYLGSGKAAQDTVRTSGRFPGMVQDVLPEAVRALAAPLYERFDFTEIPDFVYVEELNDMTRGK